MLLSYRLRYLALKIYLSNDRREDDDAMAILRGV